MSAAKQSLTTIANYPENGLDCTPTTTQTTKAPNIPTSINPLVDAAADIFSMITLLKQTADPQQASELHQELKTLIQTFQQILQEQNTASEIILAACYALCATLDETIQNTPWGANDYWEDYQLLVTLQNDHSQGERFFLILERLQKAPKHYMDLLELMFLCLTLGFKGPHRHTAYGHTQLNQTTEQLYQIIRLGRGEVKKTLSNTFLTNIPKNISKKQQWKRYAMTSTITLLLILGAGILFNRTYHNTVQHFVTQSTTQEA